MPAAILGMSDPTLPSVILPKTTCGSSNATWQPTESWSWPCPLTRHHRKSVVVQERTLLLLPPVCLNAASWRRCTMTIPHNLWRTCAPSTATAIASAACTSRSVDKAAGRNRGDEHQLPVETRKPSTAVHEFIGEKSDSGFSPLKSCPVFAARGVSQVTCWCCSVAVFVIVAACLTRRRLSCGMLLPHWVHNLMSAMMAMETSWERLSGHDGDGEPPGRPVNW